MTKYSSVLLLAMVFAGCSMASPKSEDDVKGEVASHTSVESSVADEVADGALEDVNGVASEREEVPSTSDDSANAEGESDELNTPQDSSDAQEDENTSRSVEASEENLETVGDEETSDASSDKGDELEGEEDEVLSEDDSGEENDETVADDGAEEEGDTPNENAEDDGVQDDGAEEEEDSSDALKSSVSYLEGNIEVFDDFECSYCRRFHADVVIPLREKHPNVTVTIRHFPLPFHPNARTAAQFAICADEQEKGKEMIDRLFGERNLGENTLWTVSNELELDAENLASCLGDERTQVAIDADIELGKEQGVTGTPTFFINGKKYVGYEPLENIERILRREAN